MPSCEEDAIWQPCLGRDRDNRVKRTELMKIRRARRRMNHLIRRCGDGKVRGAQQRQPVVIGSHLCYTIRQNKAQGIPCATVSSQAPIWWWIFVEDRRTYFEILATMDINSDHAIHTFTVNARFQTQKQTRNRNT